MYKQEPALGGAVTIPSMSLGGFYGGSLGGSSSVGGFGWFGNIISGLSSAHGVVDKVSSFLAGSVDGLLS